MKVLLVALGSAGDVHPMLAIGLALRTRGHAVEVLTNPRYASLVRASGLDFHPVGSKEEFDSTLRNPRLWHPIKGLGIMWRGILRPAIAPVLERITAVHRAGPCVVVATPVAFGARLAQEQLGVPLVSVYTAATMLRSVHNPLTMAQWRVPRWLPLAARRWAWRLLDRYQLEPMGRATVDTWRTKLGLPALQGSIFGGWMHSPLAGVTLFPAWFAAAAPDWPPQVCQAGFPLFDGDAGAELNPALVAFLAAGDAPIVFMPGSAMRHGQVFFQAAVNACLQLGRRGILLSDDPAQMPAALPAGVMQARYAPFGTLLPLAAALVHHGGVGSSAQAMRAGIPQLLLPVGYDQFDNALRLELRGVAATVQPAQQNATCMAVPLAALLGSPAVALACQRAAALLVDNHAMDTVCRVVEAAQ